MIHLSNTYPAHRFPTLTGFQVREHLSKLAARLAKCSPFQRNRICPRGLSKPKSRYRIAGTDDGSGWRFHLLLVGGTPPGSILYFRREPRPRLLASTPVILPSGTEPAPISGPFQFQPVDAFGWKHLERLDLNREIWIHAD